MSSPQILSTVIDLVHHHPNASGDKAMWWGQTSADAPPPLSPGTPPPSGIESPVDDPELKLPDFTSMMLVIGSNTLLQVSLSLLVEL
jgi:hypothetical protein